MQKFFGASLKLGSRDLAFGSVLIVLRRSGGGQTPVPHTPLLARGYYTASFSSAKMPSNVFTIVLAPADWGALPRSSNRPVDVLRCQYKYA